MTVIDPYENPDGVDAETAAVVEEAAPEYTDLNLQRRFRIIFALGIAVVALMAWLVFRAATNGDELASLRNRNETLTKTNESQQLLIDKLATQLDEARAQGAAVPSPEVVAADVPGAEVSPPIAPEPGAPGERGDAGLPGDVGAAGAPGSVGSAGSAGSAGSKGDPGATGAVGAEGDAGSAGSAGTNGSNGAEGAAGPAGAQGDPGPAGSQGDPGVAGPQGPQGDPGPTGPTGGMPSIYRFTFNGVAYTCTQIATGSTTYDCTID